MSDEIPPKLRLRPKLAGGPPPITPPPEALPPAVAVPQSAAESTGGNPAGFRSKPSIKPEAPGSVADAGGTPMADLLKEQAAAASADPRSFPPPQSKPLSIPPSSRPKLSLTPKAGGNTSADSGATPPFPVAENRDRLPAVLNAPPPSGLTGSTSTRETWPAVLDAPPPPGLTPLVLPGAVEAEPAEITAIRKASTFPFPSPTAKFPPLPGLSTSSGEAEPPVPVRSEDFLKKLLFISAVVVLTLVAGGVFAYFKYFAKPKTEAVASPAPAPVVPQTAPSKAMDKIKKAMEKAEQEQFAPLNEVVAAEQKPAPSTPAALATPPNPAPAQPADTSVAPAEAPEIAVVAPSPPAPVTPPPPPPPPPPSTAFKAWVINLKIRGVRGGDAQRVFIDKTSYVPGDVVNQQLGIIFTGYDESTRMISFQDKTGATFERRH